MSYPKYHKIDSVYKRDPATKYQTFLEGDWSRPEFELLADCLWVATEKVDGTNVRVHIQDDSYAVGGRTDKAELSESLSGRLSEIGERSLAAGLNGLTLYGEGFGGRIQKVGPLYGDERVTLFDVMVTRSGTFLKREDVRDIAEKVGVGVVPVFSVATLHYLIGLIRDRSPGDPVFQSRLGDCEAEGLVATPRGDFRDRLGRRIVTKIKRRDWVRDDA